jgi:hypothetical protein
MQNDPLDELEKESFASLASFARDQKRDIR